MLYGPDGCSSDDEGLSDDNEYYEFKQKISAKRNQLIRNTEESEESKRKKYLQSLFSEICARKSEKLITELDNGLDINVDLQSGWTPFLLAATIPNLDVITELIKRGVDIEQSRDGSTALILACSNSIEDETSANTTLETIKILLEKGANVNTIDRKRRTPLMLAAFNGHIEVIKILLPLSNKNALDNQKWNALFWAVEGNRADIVQLLLDENFPFNTVDIRGNSLVDVANSNGHHELLDLIPQENNINNFQLQLSRNTDFESIFEGVAPNKKPRFFDDICKIIYGSRSEQAATAIDQTEMDLSQFLALNDNQLEETGVQLPYQRNRIMGALYKFHKKPFHPKSLPFILKKGIYSNIEVSAAVLSCVRQIIAMESSLEFIMSNYPGELTSAESAEISELVCKNLAQTQRLQAVIQKLVEETEQWDSTLQNVDKITTRRRNIPWANLVLSFGVISLLVIAIKQVSV